MTWQTDEVLVDIRAERRRQDTKWGEQNHPDVDQVLMTREGGCSPDRMAAEYQVPSAYQARRQCDIAASRGRVTWAHILIEEVAEALEAATKANPTSLRDELVQVAAVAAGWIECLDRRAATSEEAGDR